MQSLKSCKTAALPYSKNTAIHHWDDLMESDYVIIGGGVVGLSVAWGLLRRGRSVTVIDGDDGSFRASRGNFGLVWVQSKGMKQPQYARWSQTSAAMWADFAAELGDNTGHTVPLEQKGGYDLHFSEETLHATLDTYETLKTRLDGNYPYDVLGHNALRKEEPHIGPKVVGAILHHQDGHANPLKLLMALAADVRKMGGQVLTGQTVVDVAKPDTFRVTCKDGLTLCADKVVLSAGLGAMQLGPGMGFKAPIRPQRGQVLITEKLPKLINRPSLIARQVDEGGIQIGATNEEVDMDDRVTQPAVSALAGEAIAAYPALARAQLVRSWGALRVLSPDGLPIYQESADMPGAYLVTCHSGITLAAAHARLLPDWLERTDIAPNLEVFSENRFDFS
jgi:glycine/D-amino acid oxidase-like deaminating enzyme